ncbi:MAG: hypothetical protein WBW99_00575, partial [Pseudolabrys sp.]
QFAYFRLGAVSGNGTVSERWSLDLLSGIRVARKLDRLCVERGKHSCNWLIGDDRLVRNTIQTMLAVGKHEAILAEGGEDPIFQQA